jgi:hypothetical protein
MYALLGYREERRIGVSLVESPEEETRNDSLIELQFAEQTCFALLP